jgi:hypothetical protein
MEISCTENVPPAPLPIIPLTGGRAPGMWMAVGLIATYFALQAVVVALFMLVAGVTAGVSHGWHDVGGAIQTSLAQPAAQALLVLFSLGVAAPLTLLLARRQWPQLWSLARPPGFGFAPPCRLYWLALAIVAGLAIPILGGLLTQWLAQGHTVTQDIQQIGSSTPLALRLPLVLMVVTVGPVVEELLFRGVLLSALLQRWRVGWAIATSSLAFALVHLPGLQFQWYALPNLILLAVVLAWLRLRTDSIWPSVLAHGTNNLLAVAAWFMVVNLPG